MPVYGFFAKHAAKQQFSSLIDTLGVAPEAAAFFVLSMGFFLIVNEDIEKM